MQKNQEIYTLLKEDLAVGQKQVTRVQLSITTYVNTPGEDTPALYNQAIADIDLLGTIAKSLEKK